ncbi:MAG: hypothetical protein ACRDRI_13125 [Pseudonocardiaceae bacterium]
MTQRLRQGLAGLRLDPYVEDQQGDGDANTPSLNASSRAASPRSAAPVHHLAMPTPVSRCSPLLRDRKQRKTVSKFQNAEPAYDQAADRRTGFHSVAPDRVEVRRRLWFGLTA